MSEGQDQKQPKRYSYTLRLEWRAPKKDEQGEISQKDLQAYISKLLGTKKES